MQDHYLELARVVVAQLEQATDVRDYQAQDHLPVWDSLHCIQVTKRRVDYPDYFLHVVHYLLVAFAQRLDF